MREVNGEKKREREREGERERERERYVRVDVAVDDGIVMEEDESPQNVVENVRSLLHFQLSGPRKISKAYPYKREELSKMSRQN